MSNPLSVSQEYPPSAFGGHGLTWAPVAITDADSPYDVLPDAVVVYADSTAGGITINLPAVASSAGRMLAIKTVGSANTVTLDPATTEQIEGGSTLVLTSSTLDGVIIHCDGSAWWVLGATP